MTSYILFDRSAADALMQSSGYQSSEFEAGAGLVAAMRGEGVAGLGADLHPIAANDGLLILGRRPDKEHCFVLDLAAADPFAGRAAHEILQILNRAIRCAHKMWRNLPAAPCERVVTSTTGGHKRVLFPFPFGMGTQWRMTIQRTGPSSNHLLAFRWGQDEAGGADEIPSEARLNLALAQLREANVPDEFLAAPQEQLELPLRVYSLEGGHAGYVALPYEGWLEHLTRPQADFVRQPLSGPQRLEGPAGTGKTLALMLKAIRTLQVAQAAGRDCHALFLTHSTATKRAIEERLLIIDHEQNFLGRDRFASPCSLRVTTLQEWCASRLGDVSDFEYLDRDATDAKELQALYIVEVLTKALAQDLDTYARFMSTGFVAFLRSESPGRLADMFQHEISTMIKGRAGENLEAYKQLPSLEHNLPMANQADRAFVFLVYRKYAEELRSTGQFDTDDIVLTAIGQLNTPVWRRRRATEGFDAVFVDETHLFNLNELSIIHHLTRDPVAPPPIVFAIDRSQAIGDRGLRPGVIEGGLLPAGSAVTESSVNTVFRSSPEILDLAFAVTAGGATLFTNFDNPLTKASSGFTSAEQRLSRMPWFEEVPTDEAMLQRALTRADQMAERLPGGRAGVAVVVFDPTLLKQCCRQIEERNRPFEVLERRGDLATVLRARETSRFLLSAPDLVGGLEFSGVVLVGVDQGRVPVEGLRAEARHFASYAAHNLLYVAISRARFEVCVLANKERGLSELLAPARERDLIVVSDHAE